RVVVRREGGDAEAVSLSAKHPERRSADRPRRPEDGDPASRRWLTHDGAHVRSAPKQTYEIGNTKRRLSTRSSTPPCPGMSVELSLTQAARLSSDSAMSPTGAAALTRVPNRMTPSRRPRKSRWAPGLSTPLVRAHTTSTLAAKPPTVPSTVLPGLTDGIS